MQLKIKEKLENYIRVLRVAKRPDKEEFITTTKVCAIGTIIIGIIGFLLYIISVVLIG
jgi:protein transport protein SEC61 subunit gamma-like protein